MAKRLFDVSFAIVGITIASPLLVLTAIGIRLSSPGPVIYCAPRSGLGGKIFTLYKFRTMHVAASQGSRISLPDDSRVFRLGQLLRKLKIDELPQLINILKGEMSVVGPRPEDPEIVARVYTPSQLRTLEVLPGLASPGSIYNYTAGEDLLDASDPEVSYVQKLLPLKLALDLIYVDRASLLYDATLIFRTAAVILQKAMGRQSFPDPPEIESARQLLALRDGGSSDAVSQ